MTKKVLLSALAAVTLTSGLIAKPNMQKNPEGMKKLMAMAGEKGPYYRAKKEVFPKDYFLVSQNLPFLVGVALFHPQSDSLKLSKEQLKELANMKKTIVPKSAKLAKEVKTLELKLAKKIVEEGKTPKELYPLVDEIAKKKAELTKAHLNCIAKVKKLLSKEQFTTLINLVSNKK